jgi:hypothetical protein
MSKLELTKLRVKLKKSSAPTGTAITAGFYSPVSGTKQPSNIQYGATSSLALTTLTTSFAFVDMPFTGVTFSTAPVDLTFLVKGTGTAAGFLQYYNSTLATTDTPVFLSTADSGSSWSPTKNFHQNDVLFEVWGTYEWPASAQQSTDYYNLTDITVTLAASAGTADRASTTVTTLNKPSVPGP